jgi:hypothetical protein
MVVPTCFAITLPYSVNVPSAFWEMLNWGSVDRILWMGVLCLMAWCVAIWDHAPLTHHARTHHARTHARMHAPRTHAPHTHTPRTHHARTTHAPRTHHARTAPKSTRTEISIAAVAGLVNNDRRSVSRMITESLNIPKTVVRRIFKKKIWEREGCVHVLFHTLWYPSKRKIESHFAKMGDAYKYLTKLLREMRPHVCQWPRIKATQFWIVWWDIPSAEVIKIPKLPHQDYVVSFLRLSRRSALRICTCRKKSKCRILQRSNGSPPEAYSTVCPAAFCSREVLV